MRQLFRGRLESETDSSTPAGEDGSRIIIRWQRSGRGRGGMRGDSQNLRYSFILMSLQLEENERHAGNILPISISRCKRRIVTHRMHSPTCPVLCTLTSKTSLLLARKTKEASQCNAFRCGVAAKRSKTYGKLPTRLVDTRCTKRLLKGESVVFALRI